MPLVIEGKQKPPEPGRTGPLVTGVAVGLLLLFLLVMPSFGTVYVGVPFVPYSVVIYYVDDRRPYAWTPAPPPGFSVEKRMIVSFNTRKSYQLRVWDWVVEVGRGYGMAGD